MLQLHKLETLNKKRKRVGRGGSRGGTSGKGHKGQRCRTGVGGELKPFFEGGQMPLSRRLPRRGFTNVFKKNFMLVNLSDLENNFDSEDIVTKVSLIKKGIIRGRKSLLLPIKILANGSLSKKLTIQADAFSKSAATAVEKAGGVIKQIKEADRGGIAA